MDEKANAATLGLIEQLETEHPGESQEQIFERYRKALVADPQLMKAAIRGVFELHYHDLLKQQGRPPPTSSKKPAPCAGADRSGSATGNGSPGTLCGCDN
jgi:hypothetical protein